MEERIPNELNDAEDIERENEDARDDATMSADDTGMISGERLIFEGETAQVDQETDRDSAQESAP